MLRVLSIVSISLFLATCGGDTTGGAGGDGGSLTILCDAEGEHKRKFINAVPALNPAFQVIPIYLSRMGLRRWEVME